MLLMGKDGVAQVNPEKQDQRGPIGLRFGSPRLLAEVHVEANILMSMVFFAQTGFATII
jgi:hypothetical protein